MLQLAWMAASLALISDLHANLVALDLVLSDIERRKVDQLVCLGDVATLGPKPREVIGRLRELGCPCILGNHDAFMLDEQLIHSYTEAQVVVDAVTWCRSQLRDADIEFLASFVNTLEMNVGNSKVYLYHGTPHSHMVELLADSPGEMLDRELSEVDADVYAGGHTHLQMLRQHRGRWVLNPGSVGMPFRESAHGKAPTILPHAEYAIVSDEQGTSTVSLHRLPIDPAVLFAQAASAPDNPITADLKRSYS